MTTVIIIAVSFMVFGRKKVVLEFALLRSKNSFESRLSNKVLVLLQVICNVCQKLDEEFLITLHCISNTEKRVTKFDVFDTLINTKFPSLNDTNLNEKL